MRLGHVGGTTPNPLKVLSRYNVWPRLPLVDRVLARLSPGMRAENSPELNRTTCFPSPCGSHDTPSRCCRNSSNGPTMVVPGGHDPVALLVPLEHSTYFGPCRT